VKILPQAGQTAGLLLDHLPQLPDQRIGGSTGAAGDGFLFQIVERSHDCSQIESPPRMLQRRFANPTTSVLAILLSLILDLALGGWGEALSFAPGRSSWPKAAYR
jgi:hypothetical protein